MTEFNVHKVSVNKITDMPIISKPVWLAIQIWTFVLILSAISFYFFSNEGIGPISAQFLLTVLYVPICSLTSFATKQNKIDSTFVENATRGLPEHPIVLEEMIDRIATHLIGKGYISPEQVPQIEHIILRTHLDRNYRPIIAKLFENDKLVPNEWFYICEKYRYYDMAKELIKIGVHPKYVYFNDTAKSEREGYEEFAIVLHSEEDYNFSKLAIESQESNFSGTVSAYSSNEVLDYIKSLKNGAEFNVDPRIIKNHRNWGAGTSVNVAIGHNANSSQHSYNNIGTIQIQPQAHQHSNGGYSQQHIQQQQIQGGHVAVSIGPGGGGGAGNINTSRKGVGKCSP